MHGLQTLKCGISASHSLTAVKNFDKASGLLKGIYVLLSGGFYALWRHFDDTNQARRFAQFASSIAHEDVADKTKIVIATENGDITLEQGINHSIPEGQLGRRWVTVSHGSDWSFLPADIETLQDVQNRIRLDITEDSETYAKFGVIFNKAEVESHHAFVKALSQMGDEEPEAPPVVASEFRKDKIASATDQSGGCQSQVKKLTYKDSGDVYFFKSSEGISTGGSVALKVAGILPENKRLSLGSMFTYAMAQHLGFDVIPKTVLAEDEHGNPGYAQKMAPGTPQMALINTLVRAAVPGSDDDAPFKVIKSNPIIVRKMMEVQWLDAIVGEPDRHGYNLFISPETSQVFGIDNDMCGGQFVTHPHNMIPSHFSEGFGKNGSPLTSRERGIIKHLQSLKDPDPVKKMTSGNGPYAGRSTLMPPVIDTNMVDKIKGLKTNELLTMMKGFSISEREAACSRVDAVKSHIGILERRQEIINERISVIESAITQLQSSPFMTDDQELQIAGLSKELFGLRENPSVIKPDEWSRSAVDEKLFHKYLGKALTISTSYLQRDIQLKLGLHKKKPPP